MSFLIIPIVFLLAQWSKYMARNVNVSVTHLMDSANEEMAC